MSNRKPRKGSTATSRTRREGSRVTLDPIMCEEIIFEGKLAWQHGETEIALHSLILATKMDPKSVKAQIELGRVRTFCNQFSSARHCFRKAIRLAPDNAEAHYLLGSALQELAPDSDESIKHYTLASKLCSLMPDAIYSLMLIHLRRHEIFPAMSCMIRYLRLKPGDQEIRKALEELKEKVIVKG